jgi:endoplasmic reticulum Man9GlcNAc2 1,2-alpha-mannosidase
MPDFSIPRNVPSFTNPQRELENRVWAASGMTTKPTSGYNSGGSGGVQSRIGGYFGKNKDLPMYKDKPFLYATARRYRPFWKQKRIYVLVGVFIVFILYLLGFRGSDDALLRDKSGWKLSQTEKLGKINWPSRRERVVEAFKLSWDAYERYAWGMLCLPMSIRLYYF